MYKRQGISIGILNFSCPTVIDEEKIKKAISTGFIITYEDHNVDTGLGATVGIYLSENGYSGKFFRFGIKDYGGSGKPDMLFERIGLGVESIYKFILKEVVQ